LAILYNLEMEINFRTNKETGCLAAKDDPSFPFVDFTPQDFKRYSNDEKLFSKKRSRMILSPLQTKVLLRVFQKTAFPSAVVRNNLSKIIGIPSRNIQIWFQNQRQKLRQRETPTSTTSGGTLDTQEKKLRAIGPLEVLARAAFKNEIGPVAVLPPPKNAIISGFPALKTSGKHLRPW
jgi:hypothetical protein